MAFFTTAINPDAQSVGRKLHHKHYFRKHGNHAYYGQTKEEK